MTGHDWIFLAVIVGLVADVVGLAAVTVRLWWQRRTFASMALARTSEYVRSIKIVQHRAQEHTAIPASRGGLQPSQPVRLADRYKVLHDGEDWEAGNN